MLLGLLAGFTYALYSRSARRLMQQKIAPRAAMGATFGAGGILLMPVLLFTGAPLLTAWNNAAVGIYMALVPMFIGYLCYGYGLARIPASGHYHYAAGAGGSRAAGGAAGRRRLSLSGWTGVALIVGCLMVITLPAKRLPFGKRATLTNRASAK